MADRLIVELETKPCRCDIRKLFIRELTVSKMVVACLNCHSECEIGFPKYLADVVEPSPFPELPVEEAEKTLEVGFKERENPERDARARANSVHRSTFTPGDVSLLRAAKIVIDDAMLDEMRTAAGSPTWNPPEAPKI